MMTYMLDQYHFTDEIILKYGQYGEHYDCVKPHPGKAFTSDHMPDLTPVLTQLNFTTQVKKKGINMVYFLNKAFPFKCQVRKVCLVEIVCHISLNVC
jgi:hypothetical protein